MGYKLVVVPGVPIKSVVGICDQMLSELKTTHRHPLPVEEITVPEMPGGRSDEPLDLGTIELKPAKRQPGR